MNKYVVIPVKNQIHYTQGIVHQLLDQGEAHEILIIDNGSTDGTFEWLLDQPVGIVPAEGLNIHEMWNLGLQLAHKGESGVPHDVAILNNDLRIGEKFLSRLSRTLRDSSRFGVVGANYDGREFEGYAQTVHGVCGGRYDGTGGLPGFAFMVRGEEGYRFPEALHWWYGDTDLVATVLASGRLAVIARRATCEHLDGGGRTGDWASPEMQPLLAADRAWFEAKWNASSGT